MSSVQEVINLKLKKAKSLFAETDVLMANKFYTTTINRLYYSCFYATSAFILTKGYSPKTHKGVSKVLHEHFVNQGYFDMEQAAFFGYILQERMQDDYNDFLIIEEEEVVEFIDPAKKYIAYIENLIEEYFKTNNS